MNANGKLLFRANDGISGSELWTSDGTAAGTTAVRDIYAGSIGALQSNAIVQAGTSTRVVFGAADSVSGMEPWYSNGTIGGTNRAADLATGALSSNPSSFVTVGARIFFVAYDAASGTELYAMPLGAVGGALVANIGAGCPGTGGLVPRMAATGQPVLGNASWTIDVTQARASTACVFGIAGGFGTIPIGGGCNLHLLPPMVTLNASTDAAGRAVTPVSVPNDSALLGAQVWSQYFIVDPNGAYLNQLSFSDALHCVIGN